MKKYVDDFLWTVVIKLSKSPSRRTYSIKKLISISKCVFSKTKFKFSQTLKTKKTFSKEKITNANLWKKFCYLKLISMNLLDES